MGWISQRTSLECRFFQWLFCPAGNLQFGSLPTKVKHVATTTGGEAVERRAIPVNSQRAQYLRPGESEMFDQVANFREPSARFHSDQLEKTCRHTLQPRASL